jgi:hypothetical protein
VAAEDEAGEEDEGGAETLSGSERGVAHGLVELDQKRAYGNLLIAKTELFADAAA